MLKETVEIKVDYEKAGVSSEGCVRKVEHDHD